jgi:hypothetical protein
MLQSQQLSHNSEAYIYEEEDYSPDSNDEDYLTIEDRVFIASILDPTDNEICLPSIFFNSPTFSNSSDYNASLESNFLFAKETTTGLHYSLHLYGKLISAKKSADGTEFENIFPVIFFNQYRIFLWDPGIYFYFSY